MKVGPRILTVGVTIALSGVFAATASAEPANVSGGYADWGVKESFRTYIEGPGGGAITTGDGATRNEDGSFRFPVVAGEVDPDTGFGEVQLGGSVHFTAHGGALDIMVADPRLEITASGSALYADAKSQPMGPGEPIDDHRDLVALDADAVEPALGPKAVRWNAIPAIITENGSPVFNYSVGTAMDPVSLVARLPQAARVTVRAKSRLGKANRAAVARVRCVTGPCTVATQKRAKVRVNGRRFNARVKAPARIAEGKRSAIAVKMTKRVAKKLAGKHGRVRFAVTVNGSSGLEAKRIIKTKLIGRVR